MEKMPPFPNSADYDFQDGTDIVFYERVLRLAWEARARLAVEYISLVNEHGDIGHPDVVLAAIGELPEQK